jgi:hypothetical protein
MSLKRAKMGNQESYIEGQAMQWTTENMTKRQAMIESILHIKLKNEPNAQLIRVCSGNFTVHTPVYVN